jgi:hypothetical protein
LLPYALLKEWLKVLANKKIKVNITIKTKKGFELQIEDNGPAANFETMRKEVFESTTFDMAQSQGGKIDLSISTSAKNLFKLALPAAASVAGLVF